jgi:hypothetical protein
MYDRVGVAYSKKMDSMFAIKYNFRWFCEPIEDCEREDEGVGSIPGGSAWSQLRRER